MAMRGDVIMTIALAVVAVTLANYEPGAIPHEVEGLQDAPIPFEGPPVLDETVLLQESAGVRVQTGVGGEVECGDGFETQSFVDANHITTTTCTAPVELDCPLNTKKSVMVDDMEDANKKVTFKCENCNPGAEAPEGCELMFACTDAHCENYCKYSSGRDATCRACPKDYTWKASVNDTINYGRIRGHDPCRRSCNECAGKDGSEYYGYCIWVAAHNHMMIKRNLKAKKLRDPTTSDDEDCAVETGNADNKGGDQ
jgi:hypothetical protein